MSTFMQNLRYALRQLRSAPAFAATAILTLALGIGANTAVFSLLDQALLRSLPVRDPQQLVVLEGTGKAWQGHTGTHGGDVEAYFSYPMYRDLRDRNQAFQGLAATSRADVGFTRAGTSQVVDAEIVSGNYFAMLGVRPAMGRLFTQSDDAQKDSNPVAVVSFSFWQGHLGADPQIIGETVEINGHPFQVIGVSSPHFRSAIWGENPALFVPMSMLEEVMPGKGGRLSDHTDRWMNIIGRLKDGESRSRAQLELAPFWHALRAEELKALGNQSQRFTDEFLTRSRLLVLPGANGFSFDRDDYEKPLLAVLAMAWLVLLIATVNVSSLLLVRSAGRVREFSLRYALGAQAKRIVQQLLLEGLLLGSGGGAAGMLIAILTERALVHRLAARDGSGDFITSIDGRLLLFNFALALVVSVVFSLAPALQLRRPNLSSILGQQRSTGGGGTLSFRRLVVCLQIGLSVVLLVGAGLFVRTMQKLRAVDVGFTTSHLVGFGINPKFAGYSAEATPALNQRVIETLVKLPGVQAVAATNDPELTGSTQGGNMSVAGSSSPPDQDLDAERSYVSENYFSTLGIGLLAGRAFNASDDLTHPLVSIVNESFVKHFCSSAANCLGRMMADGSGNKLNIQIVGVVRDAKHSGLRDAALPTSFRPLRQQANQANIFVYVRTFSEPAQALPMVRAAMQQFDPKLALDQLGTMDEQIEDSLRNDKLVLLLAVCFGLLAALLTGVGIYGVLAYATAQRTREIGIRIALGSSRLAISRIVLTDVLILAGVAIAVALPLASGLSHLIQSELYGVSPADPFSLLAAVLIVSSIALCAAVLPAHRAASIDPNDALRTE